MNSLKTSFAKDVLHPLISSSYFEYPFFQVDKYYLKGSNMFRAFMNFKPKMNFSPKVKNFSPIKARGIVTVGFTTGAIAVKLSNSKKLLEQPIEKPTIEHLPPNGRKVKLIQKLILLEPSKNSLEQSEKDNLYKEIISLRPTCSKDFDVIGYNQLHWAILCNQSINEIKRLMNENIDINKGTEFAESIVMFNVTPLHIAIHVGNKELTEFLLRNGAHAEYRLNHYLPLHGPLSGNDYSTIGDNVQSAAKFALHKKNGTFRLFENQLLKEYIDDHSNNQNEYNSIFPSRVAACFYYSNEEELKAAKKFNKLLNNEPDNIDKLVNLKNKHPAVLQDQLGEIYSSSIKARM